MICRWLAVAIGPWSHASRIRAHDDPPAADRHAEPRHLCGNSGKDKVLLSCPGLVLEQQRREFVQASSPGLPLMGGLRRNVVAGVDAGRLKCVGVNFRIAAEGAAAPAGGGI